MSGKARRRDPVRSSHSYTAWRYGHKWVVLAVLVKFPFATRPWALPVLIDLIEADWGGVVAGKATVPSVRELLLSTLAPAN